MKALLTMRHRTEEFGMERNYLAFDVGGTTIKYSVINEDLEILRYGKFDTKKNIDNHILKTLEEVTMSIQKEIELCGIGVSTAGIVGKDGSIQYAGPTIPNYINTPIKSALSSRSKTPVSVINDVDAALLGEVYARNLDQEDVYCIALGTGIGGAHYRHGELIGGAHGKSNSIGYSLFDIKTGTNYEQRASTLTLEARLAEYNTTVVEAFEKAKQNQMPFIDIIKAWVKEVARGLAEIIVLFDPNYIVIGGAVSAQGDYLLGLLNETLTNLLPLNFNQIKLSTAKQGNNAQLIGAIVPLLNNKA